MTPAGAAVGLFQDLTGREATELWTAPGRVNLIGEHTDYNDGFVFPFAIDARTALALGRRADQTIRVTSTFADDAVEIDLADLPALFPENRDRVPEWARYPLGVAWALLQQEGVTPHGLDLAFASEVPVGAGLSSSAAIESAAAMAIAASWGLELDRVALAQIGRRAENEAVGAPTGIMDQMAVMLGRADSGIFLDCRSLDAAVVDLGFDRAELAVLVIDTHVAHSHATGGYGDRRDACERGAAALGVTSLRDATVQDLDRAAELLDDVTFRRVRHVVTENDRVQETVRTLHADGPRAIGPLLDASHVSMRDDFEISVPELDLAVETARAAGAIGARMTGGGFGGAAIALLDRRDLARAADAIRTAFADAGYVTPTIFTVTPSEGARREG